MKIIRTIKDNSDRVRKKKFASPTIKLSIRVISDLKFTCNYLSDLNEILYSEQLEDGKYCCDSYFSKFLCHALNLAITQGNQVTCNYLSDLNEILYGNQLEDGVCKDGIHFSNFLCHTYNQAINWGNQ